MEMNPQDFKYIQQFLAESCGIVLTDAKQYLVKNRLSGLLEHYRMSSFGDLVNALRVRSGMAERLKVDVIEAMTTNETFWFREEAHFTELKEVVLPEMLARKGGIRIWSAACSSGQEPYTISMCVEDFGKSRFVKIIGTDISENVLKQARAAVYTKSSLARGMATDRRERFFHPVENGYKLNSAITERVRFQQFNLLKPFAALGRFDIVFCRNVLIYFSDELKRDILKRIASVLEAGGILFLSSTEVMPAEVSGFEAVRGKHSRYYRKIG